MIDPHTFAIGDIILARFPYEDAPNMFTIRPAVIVDKHENNLTVVALKITSTPPRDKMDYELVNWALAGLANVSTVRTSKKAVIIVSAIIKKIGALTPDDFSAVMALYNRISL